MKTIALFSPRFTTTIIALAAGVWLAAKPANAATVIWSGADTNTGNYTWADGLNWSGGTPAGNDVRFFDPGTALAASNINNIVSANTSVSSLRYGNTNNFHTTLINPGVTLTVTNAAAANLVFVGTLADNGASQIVNATVTGAGGRLVVISTNVASTMVVQQGSSASGAHLAILDLSGLDNFNLTAGRLLPGGLPLSNGTPNNNASNHLTSLVILAKTNLISLNGTTTPTLNIGDAVSNGGSGDPNNVQLGQTNGLFIDNIAVGHSKSWGNLLFNPSLAGNNPSVYLRGRGATNRVAALAVGDNSVQTTSGSPCSGTVDFSLGSVDAQVNTCYVGRGQNGNGSGTATGALTIGAGIFNVNTLYAGYVNIATATARVTGTVNVTNGTLVVMTNLILGYNPGSASANAAATLNISNGVVYANTITSSNGNVTSAINMTGGTLVVSNTAGTPNFPLGALNLGSATLQIAGGQVVGSVVASSLNLLDSSSVINVSSIPVLFGYPSQVPLISYTSLAGGSTINLGTLPGTYKGYISNDLVSTVWLVVTNGPSTAKADQWGGGVNNLWNTSALNWTNAGVAVPYSENDSVAFDDLGKTGVVNVVSTHTPLGFNVTNNTLNYTLTGVGSITGVVGLNKQGSGTLTLAQTGGDNFSGGIVVGGGTVILDDANCAISGGVGITNGATLQIGNNDANGALPAGIVDDEGTLLFSRSDNVLLTTGFGGGGGLAQTGSGALTLNSPMTYTGNTIIGKGILALTNTATLSNSVSVLVSNATFDVSGLGGQTTLLNSLTVTNASLNVALTGLLAPISVVSSLNADGIVGVSNKINVLSLPVLASYPVTFTVIQSAGISLAAGNFNFIVGSLPAGYAGNVSESPDSTAVLLTITSGPVGVRPSVVWSGADIPNLNTNWSDRLNWFLPGVPTPVDNLIFNNTATLAASVLSTPGGGLAALSDPENFNNIVDASFTVASVSFTNANGTYHNTAIASGATLTLTNSLTVGAMNLTPVSKAYVTVAGAGGTLNVNTPNAALQVWDGNGTTAGASGSQATLDLSALDNFSATVSQFAIGAAVGGAVNYTSGILYLAKTNNITTTFQTTTTDTAGTAANAGFVMADCIYNAGLQSSNYLGQANTISADSIAIGRQKASATLQFNSIYANIAPYPSLTLQGYSSSSIGLFEVGGGAYNTGTTTLTADANLTGGIVSAKINTLSIGMASTAPSGAGTTTGKLEFDAGTISASTANVGFQPVANATKVGVGSVTIGTNPSIGTNATLSVSGNLNLAVNQNSSATAGTLDISGGVLQANAIVAGANGSVSTITLENSGTLVITNFAGTPAAPINTLNLNGGTLQLNINGSALVTNIVATTISAGGSTTINIGAIANGLGLTTIPLISYTGSDPFSSITLGTLPAGFAGTLVDDIAASRIDLNLTTTPTALTWVGAVGATLNGNWNFGNLNWQNLGSPAAYADPEFVTFNDSASNSAVTVAATVTPSEINVTNNSLNYVFSGSGRIAGSASITKSGSGALTLAETGGDNFSGGITVNPNGGSVVLDNANSTVSGGTAIGSASTLQVGNNDANGALPAGSVANNGTLIFQRTSTLAVPNVISGSGGILQSGSGVSVLSGVNSYGGGTLVSSGTLQLVANNSLVNLTAAGTGTITNNSVLSITNGGGTPGYVLVTNTISGIGVVNLPQNQEVNFNGPGNMSNYTGTINIPAGTALAAKGDITSTNVNLSASAMINVASGGTLWVANTGVTVPATLNLIGSGNGEGWGALRVDTAGIYSGPVILQGNATIGAQNTSSGTISGVISDGGHNYSLTKLGAQTVILTGANTYGGGTIISNTTLQIGNGLVNGTLPGNVNIAVTNATLSFVVTNTQTYSGIISGPGSLYENGYGGTLNLNGMNTFTNGVTINAGALWITNAAALGSGAKMITIVNGTAGHPELHLNGVSGNILLPATLSFTTSWIGSTNSPGALINEAGNNEIDGSFNLFSGGGGTAFVVNGGTLKLAGTLAPTTTLRTVQLGGVGNGTVSGVVADNGTNLLTGVSVVGPGTWTLAGTNTYVTNTTVSGGRLLVNGVVGSGGLAVQTNATLGGSGTVGGVTTVQAGGSIQGGDANYSNTLTVATLNLGNTNNVTTYSRFTVAAGGKVAATTLNVSGTNVVQILDASLTVGTNTLFTYTGTIGGTNGFGGFQLGTLPSGVTAQLLNAGSAVKLAVTSVVTVNTNSPVLTNSLSSGTLRLSWPADHLGWRLEVQTNALNTGLRNNWFTWPNSTNVTSVPITLNPANPTVFFRLVYP